MARPEKFAFERARGIVWVCDVAGSSSRLNSDVGVGETEAFLPRLYWISNLIVESAGGKLIKWTGDGFLAWFETPLHRDLHGVADRCLEALWHLTVMVNVTQLGLTPKRRFKIRHGLAYEQDALLMKITQPGGFEMVDLIGRSVVLAFRLSGVTADFPCITTQREIIEALGKDHLARFRRWIPTGEERLRYFKGERWGTEALFVSTDKRPAARSWKSVTRQANRAIRNAEGETAIKGERLAFSKSLYVGLSAGPEWGQKVAKDYLDFIRDGLLGNLKAILSIAEKAKTT